MHRFVFFPFFVFTAVIGVASEPPAIKEQFNINQDGKVFKPGEVVASNDRARLEKKMKSWVASCLSKADSTREKLDEYVGFRQFAPDRGVVLTTNNGDVALISGFATYDAVNDGVPGEGVCLLKNDEAISWSFQSASWPNAPFDADQDRP